MPIQRPFIKPEESVHSLDPPKGTRIDVTGKWNGKVIHVPDRGEVLVSLKSITSEHGQWAIRVTSVPWRNLYKGPGRVLYHPLAYGDADIIDCSTHEAAPMMMRRKGARHVLMSASGAVLLTVVEPWKDSDIAKGILKTIYVEDWDALGTSWPALVACELLHGAYYNDEADHCLELVRIA